MKTFSNVAALVLARLQAGQFVSTGGYTTKGGPGAATYFIKTPAQAAADGDVIDGFGNHTLANGNVAILQIKGTFNVEAYGVSESQTDNKPQWQALLNNPAISNAHFSDGTYKFLSGSDCNRDIKVTQDDGCTIDCTDPGFTGNYWTNFEGAITQIEDLSANTNVGDRTLTFVSPPTLSVNDVFIIFNPTNSSWSGFRPNYFAGEFCRVVAISGSTVTVSGELYDSYVAGSVDIYRLDPIKVSLNNLNVIGDLSLNLIQMEFCRDSVIESPKIFHKNDSAIALIRSYNCSVINPAIHNEGDGGDDYGISVANCQTIKIRGGDIYSRRHAVTTGGDAQTGAVTCRDIRILNATISNDINSGVFAADFHGNTEDSTYVNCEIFGGATFQGKNNGYVDCRIGARDVGSCILTAEILGGRHYAINCHFHTTVNPQLTSRGVIDIGGNNITAVTSDTLEDCEFIIEGGSINGTNFSASTSAIVFRNVGTIQKVNFKFSGVHLNVDDLGQVLFTQLASGIADSDYIIIDQLTTNKATQTLLANHNSASYRDFPHRLQEQTGSETVTINTASSTTNGALVNFPWRYPRTPHTQVGRNNRAYAGNRIGVPYASVSDATITPSISTDDGTNFTGAVTVDLQWRASIDEV